MKLGRHSDPRVPSDCPPWKRRAMQWGWTALRRLGSRRLVRILFPRDTLCFFDIERNPGVRGLCAFTIDDAFCGLDNPGGDKTRDVVQVLEKYGAKATFFVTGSHVKEANKDAVKELVEAGHELAHHGWEDRPYHTDTESEFQRDFENTEAQIKRFQPEPAPWYRAPHARYTTAMDTVLKSKGITHVMVDAFAHDTAIPDPAWIAQTVLAQVTDGSIALIHMPEVGCREWTLEAMDLFFQGLTTRGFRAVTVTQLVKAAGGLPAAGQ